MSDDRILFWFNNHPLTPLADAMQEKFIPASGKTEYVESEVLRAALRLNHDYFNNGFGNNMSHAVAFIEKYHLPQATPEFKIAFADIREGAMEPWNQPCGLDEHFNTLLSEVLLRLDATDKVGKLTPLVEEMFDMPYKEIDYPQDEEDEYELAEEED